MRLAIGPALLLAAGIVLAAALYDVAVIAARAVDPWISWMFP
jgi:hypothetical protein